MEREQINSMVSVLVITYNSAKYILDTLESIKAQSYANIELIISDDGSTDNTVEIARGWLTNCNNRFVNASFITSKVNTGIPANCNRGLAVAKGKYLKIIAGDDLLQKSCIEDNLAFARLNNSVFTFSKMNELTEDGLQSRVNPIRQKALNEFINKGENQLKFYIRNPIFINSPTFFIQVDLLRSIGGFDESFDFLEDQPMIIKILAKKVIIRFFDSYTVTYRTHSTSISFSKNYIRMTRDLYNCLVKYRFPNIKKTDIVSILYLLNDWISFNKQLSNEHSLRHYLFKILYRLNPFIILGINRQ